MAIPNSGQISKKMVFREIYDRLPVFLSEIFTLKKLINDSCLPPEKKIAPYHLRAFLGYDHSLCNLDGGGEPTREFSWKIDHICTIDYTSTFDWNDNYHCVIEDATSDVYSATSTVWVSCPEGYSGSQQTATATEYSNISQADAQSKADTSAATAANAKLTCTPFVYSATSTVWVSCPEGYSGSQQTATATEYSNISQADAQSKADTSAVTAANAKLTCTPFVYSATSTVWVSCPDGYSGSQQTATATEYSNISYADAQSKADTSAVTAANAKLTCTPNNNGGGGGGGTDVGGEETLSSN